MREGDELVDGRLTDGGDDVLLVSRNGSGGALRRGDVRARWAARHRGVLGMRLRKDDEVIAIEVARDDQADLLVVTENGYGKRTRLERVPDQGARHDGRADDRLTEARGRLAGVMVVRDGSR